MLKEQLLKRFIAYTGITSQSDATISVVPSTKGQWELAKLLEKDLRDLGLIDLKLSPTCVLIGHLPANLPSGYEQQVPSFGFVAHLDTVDVSLSPDLQPQLIKYTGGDVMLNQEHAIVMKASEHPELSKYVGQDILFSNGLGVLGADNKAAISAITVALEELQKNPKLLHGDIYFAFVPDEETGLRGSKTLDLADFPVEFAYTIDCCELGEVVYETFNGGAAKITIQGVSAHPMSAKGVLVNPTLIAMDLANCFDRKETPENTDGKDGYIWVKAMSSNQSTATLMLDIRDHHKDLYEAKKDYIKEVVEFIRKRYPAAVIKLDLSDTYGNIADAITEDNRMCIDYIYAAMKNLEITPKTIAMRGSTDGSVLSAKGLLTPNFFTGGHNFHSKFEFLPMDSFQKSCQMVLELVRLTVKE